MGVLLALSFCPTTAFLFFGGLLPLAVEHRSALLLPAMYGLGASISATVLGAALAMGANWIGRVSRSIQAVEKWSRLATGTLFILVGIYWCLRYSLGLF
jgi:cytochrome c biogenesis protein CcdA